MAEAFPPLVNTEIPARYKAAALDGTPWHTEQVEYADGKITGAFEVNAFGTHRGGMVAIFSDITGRKRDEVALAAEKAFSEILIESLPGIFYLYSYPELRMVLWNRNHETDLDYGPGELAGKSVFDYHLPAAREAVRAAIEDAMSSGGNAIEAPLLHKDGAASWYILTGAPYEADGKRYLMGVGIGIGDRKRAEEELKRLNAELESRVEERTAALTLALAEARDSRDRAAMAEKMAALGHLVAGLAHELNTPLGAILSANESCANGVRALPEAVALRSSLAEPDRRLFDSLLATALSGDWARDAAEFRARRRRVVAALEAAGVGEPELVAERLAESGFGADETALAAAARSAALGPVTEAVYRLGSIASSVGIVRAAAEKAAKVIRALRAYSRHDPSDELAEVDLAERIDIVLTLYHNLVKRGVELTRRYGDVPKVRCFPEELDQVWMNLVSNALQAMGYRGKLEITIEASPDGRRVVVTVSNDGPPIPEELRDRIFEPFFTTKEAGEGTGLGLDICRKVLERIGGSIGFESAVGRTAFTVTLDPDFARKEAP